ncbi:MAG: hypothetical protein RLZZ628_717 [Bacteroidota bacterium]|jgi:hypothetical protein
MPKIVPENGKKSIFFLKFFFGEIGDGVLNKKVAVSKEKTTKYYWVAIQLEYR